MALPQWLAHLLQALSHGSPYPLFFNTVLFAALFTLLYALQLALARYNAVRLALLLLFSLYFYYKTSGWFVLLLCATAAHDWLVGLGIFHAKKQWQKDALLYLSLAVNLGLLGFFKYALFFTRTWYDLWSMPQPELVWHVALPIGISFYTFKTLSYVIDVHRETIEAPTRNYLHYLLYVSFFANILAGPITRAGEFLPQLGQRFVLTREQLGRAVFLFALGLIKKVVVADYLAANFTDRVLDSPGAFTGLENLLSLYGYAIQLYCDFSGYTDMALAVALLLGFELTGNFNEPFKATSVSNFWRRWHITLSSWFNDYVFMPLNFSWRAWGRWGVALAALVTFLLSGLWHGAGWGFVLWGLAHGAAIGYEALAQQPRAWVAGKLPHWLYNPLSTVLTFHFLLLTYILFRTHSLADAATCAQRILNNFSGDLFARWLEQYLFPALVLLLGLAMHFAPTRFKQWLRQTFVGLPWPVQALALALVVVLVYQSRTAGLQPFIYLQF
jgi:D-alanyl-lipoteichoic acid acyltransferase DltB (MBOAT superfamily)